MAIDVTTFLTRFPEFTETNEKNSGLIDQCLAAAQSYCDVTRWGSRYQEGVFLKAAHILSLHPFGGTARLNKWDDRTIYSTQFDEMKRALPVRMMLV